MAAATLPVSAAATAPAAAQARGTGRSVSVAFASERQKSHCARESPVSASHSAYSMQRLESFALEVRGLPVFPRQGKSAPHPQIKSLFWGDTDRGRSS